MDESQRWLKDSGKVKNIKLDYKRLKATLLRNIEDDLSKIQ